MKPNDELEELITVSLPIEIAFIALFELWKTQKVKDNLTNISKENKKKFLQRCLVEYRDCIMVESKSKEIEALAFFYFILNQL